MNCRAVVPVLVLFLTLGGGNAVVGIADEPPTDMIVEEPQKETLRSVRIADEPTTGMLEEDNTFTPDPDADSSVLGVDTLEDALAEGDVAVSTGSAEAGGGHMVVADDLTWQSETDLTLRAGQDVRLLEDVTITHAGEASMTLRADKSAAGNGTVDLAEQAQIEFSEGGTVEILYNPPDGYDSPVDFSDRVSVAADGDLRAMILINDVDDLQAMQDNLSGDYALGGDIDATETADWNDGAGFEPIGDGDDPFTGTLDGRGHAIKGLTIDRPEERFVGLFGAMGGTAAIQGLELAEVDIHGGGSQLPRAQMPVGIDGGVGALAGGMAADASVTGSEASGDVSGEGLRVGGLVGKMWDGASVTDSQSSGDVSGEAYVGGLVGWMSGDASVTASQASGDVSGDARAGGLVGHMWGGASVTGSQATGDVAGQAHDVGGLVGRMSYDASVTASRASGDVSGEGMAGGLVGWMSGDASVTASRASGDVSGEAYVGGLVGWMGSPHGPHSPTLEQTYATGHVEGDDADAGGLIGLITNVDEDGNVSASFFDTDTTGTDEAVGEVIDSDDLEIDVTGLPTEQMQQREPFIEAGWDFDEQWTIEEGESYPRLRVLEDADVAADGDPQALILIKDVDDLQAMQDNLSGEYALGGDIDATETADWNDGAGFEPIGDGDDPFTGTLDGRGHAIEGLTIDRPEERFVGLFGAIGGTAAIQGLELAEVDIHGGGSQLPRAQMPVGIDGGVGALAGGMGDDASVTASEASGDVSGEGLRVGGLVGGMQDDASVTASRASGGVSGAGGLVGAMRDDASVTDSQASGDVSGGGSFVGGLVGGMSGAASVTASQASGDVSGEGGVGGLVGAMRAGASMTVSQASGDVSGEDEDVGGLVGSMFHAASVTASYASGDVSGARHVGGLVGQIGGWFGPHSPTVEQAYATGHVEGDDAEAGGLIGLIKNVDEGGNVSASFFDTDTTGTDEAVGEVIDSDDLEIDFTGLPTEQMQQREPFIEAGWDFDEQWTIEEGESYPRLRVLEDAD